MALRRFHIRTLMIAVAAIGLQCWLGASAVRFYWAEFGPVSLSFQAWVWVLKVVLIGNGIIVLILATPAFGLWHSWRFASLLRRAFGAARPRPWLPVVPEPPAPG